MSSTRKLTVDDLYLLGEDVRAELIDGVILPKAMSSHEHSTSQGQLMAWAGRRYRRKPGGRWPGGWWIGPEVHVVYERHHVYCHDLAGWRQERLPADLPHGWMTVRPDWVCEVLSLGHEHRDRVDKMATMHRHAVPHYWILDHGNRTVQAYRYSTEGYLLVRTARSGDVLRLEPFAEVELRAAVIFGDEDDEE